MTAPDASNTPASGAHPVSDAAGERRAVTSAIAGGDARATSAGEAGLNREPASWRDALLLAAILILSLIGIGGYGLYEPHEAHFAGVGREMVTRGDWITPHLNGDRYLTKPPLLYWSIAASYKLFGFSEWAARLPLALIGWSGVVLSWNWARRLWGIRAGRMAAVILAVSSGWYLFAHQLMIEALLAVLYLASLYFFWRAALAPERKRYWALFYASLGLGILAKGPIGAFALPAAAAYCIWRRDWRLLRHCRPLLGALIIAALVAPWLAPMELRNPGYIRYSLVNENLKRAMDTRWPPDYSVSKASIPMFALVSMVWLMPWSLLSVNVGAFAWRHARRLWRAGASGGVGSAGGSGAGVPAREGGGDDSAAQASGALLLGFAMALPLLFFVPIPSRLIYYSLPALPPFALLTAGWLDSVARGGAGTRWQRALTPAPMILAGLLVFTAGLWLPRRLAQVADLQAAPDTLLYMTPLCMLMGLGMLAAGVLLLARKPGWGVAALGVLLGVAGAVNTGGFAAFDPVRSSKRLVLALSDAAGEDCIWVSEGSKEIGASAGIAYYLGLDKNGQARRVLIVSDDPRRPPPRFPDPQPDYLIGREALDRLWQSPQPVLFVTDFLRTPKDWQDLPDMSFKDWQNRPGAMPPMSHKDGQDGTGDKPRFPAGKRFEVRIPGASFNPGGHRHVYANAAAWDRLRAYFAAAR